jgi:hypothetical protein
MTAPHWPFTRPRICGMKAVWSEVAALARCPDMTGGRIVVTNQTGEVVILIGAATARSFPIAPEAACVHAA